GRPATQARGYDDLSAAALERLGGTHVGGLERGALSAALAASVTALIQEGEEATLENIEDISGRLAELRADQPRQARLMNNLHVAGIETPLCRDLGIKYPIFSVGFVEGAGPELVAAVTDAGGCGVLGSCPPDEIRRRVSHVRELTAGTFGQNQIIAAFDEASGADDDDREEARQRIEAAIDEKVPVLVLFWGDPSPFVKQAHANGVKVFVQTGSVAEAVRAAEAGVDAVIAQGVEAGGHVRATESLWVVLPKVVDAIKPVPVIASGGIGDGAAIARALRLGAQGVSMGTRFVASEEAWTHRVYKERIVSSTAADTLLTTLFDVWWPDAPHRVLRNRVVREWEAAGRPSPGSRPREDLPAGRRRRPWSDDLQEWPRYAVGIIPPDFEGDPEDAPMWAGTSVDSIDSIKPAAEIVRELAAEAEAALERAQPRAT
ncbi:MAG TPA: nitronate monooxygenase, partial [Candidatus Dormibacteraeota bacterium]|nr:nitronate monooxygenase [Candidatus Dormibacteraeota bacterium]